MSGTSGAEAERGLPATVWCPTLLLKWKPRVPSGPLGMRTMLAGTERRLSAKGLERPDSCPPDPAKPRRRRTHGLYDPPADGGDDPAVAAVVSE